MKTLIETLLRQALAALPEDLVPARRARLSSIEVETTRDAQHGDFASNLAMRLAKATRQNPRKLARGAGARRCRRAGGCQGRDRRRRLHQLLSVEGRLSRRNRRAARTRARHTAARSSAPGVRVQVEFVSANPTDPLHVGHGRHAAFGATVTNLLEAVGYHVEREYYINDAGRQMEILAVSTWLRYLEHCGEHFTFPANGYRGEYFIADRRELFAAEGDRPASMPLRRYSRTCRRMSRRAAIRTSISTH